MFRVHTCCMYAVKVPRCLLEHPPPPPPPPNPTVLNRTPLPPGPPPLSPPNPFLPLCFAPLTKTSLMETDQSPPLHPPFPAILPCLS